MEKRYYFFAKANSCQTLSLKIRLKDSEFVTKGLIKSIENGEALHNVIKNYPQGFNLKYGYFCTNDTMTEGNDTYIKEGEEASPPRISKIYIAPSIQKVQRKDLEKQYFEQFGEGEENFEKTNREKDKLLELLSSPAQEFYKESCAIIRPINEDVFVLNEEQVGYKKGLSLDQRLTNSL